jgi:hypothetical protein
MSSSLETIYAEWCRMPTASSPHLPTLRSLASECGVCVELGCRDGASATALLLGTDADVYSFDIEPRPRAMRLAEIVGERWHYVIGDSRTADVPECDLMFVDAQHDYAHVNAELLAHAGKVRKYLCFHDTITFGSHGAIGESGRYDPEVLGIRPAIDQLMMRDESWRLVRHDTHSHGFLVLQRKPHACQCLPNLDDHRG